MNFDPIGIDSKGMYYVKFRSPLNIVERINLLERWILVQSFAYYELDENIAADSVYDANSHQLAEMLDQYPDESKRSRYRQYFYDFTGDTGYHLIGRVQKGDPKMYRRIWRDACVALDLKKKYMNAEV